jgi:ABC-type multidrug transport system fused ATPase/permease subunit
LVGTSLINYFALKAYRRYAQKNKTRWAETDKRQNYIIKTSSDYTSGKDIRLYSMSDLFISLRDILLNKQVKNSRDKNMKALKASYVDVLIVLLRDGLSYTYLVYMTITKQISIPDFIMYFAAITQFSKFVANIIEAYHNVSSGNLSFCDTREYIEMSDPADPTDPASISDMNGDYSIDFEKVTFCYPGTTEPILDSIDIHIKKGEKIALVGINGAGKTTIVKLICGFYKPTSGEIKIGGVDIQKLKHADLTSIISTVFQDIAIFPFTISSNVSMKEKEVTDEKKVMECLELAGLKDYVCSLPKGSETQMQRVIYEDGAIMSGGQQQKLLLARSLYKDTHILILDEPTAALDPIAEREMYEKYEKLTKNKAVLFISHRLASTRFCDRIMFIENGKITETGSHRQLIKQGGGYARMFDIQSHYYKENITEGKDAS